MNSTNEYFGKYISLIQFFIFMLIIWQKDIIVKYIFIKRCANSRIINKVHKYSNLFIIY